MKNDIQPELVSLRTKLAESIEEAEKQRDLLTKQIDKDRALLHAIHSSLAVKVAQVTGSGGLAGAVRAVVKSLENNQFTPVDVEKALLRQFPAVPTTKEGIRTALWNLLGKGELKTIRKGNNQQPALYERANRNGSAIPDARTRARKKSAGVELLPTNGE
jgi:hypothetical protein